METTAKEIMDTIRNDGLIACFETAQGEIYFDLSRDGDKIDVGCACNIGILTDFVFEVDQDFSADANLQALSDEVYARYGYMEGDNDG